MDPFCWPFCAQLLQVCPTLYDTVDYTPPGSCAHGNSPVKNTGVGFHALLQVIFPTQGLAPGLLNAGRFLESPWNTWIQYHHCEDFSYSTRHHTHTHTHRHTHTHIHTGTHTCTHTGTHTRTHTGTHIHMHTHSRHWPPKLCYFYVFHPSSLATLIKLEFDTTPIDKIRLYKVVSKNSSL